MKIWSVLIGTRDMKFDSISQSAFRFVSSFMYVSNEMDLESNVRSKITDKRSLQVAAATPSRITLVVGLCDC